MLGEIRPRDDYVFIRKSDQSISATWEYGYIIIRMKCYLDDRSHEVNAESTIILDKKDGEKLSKILHS